MNTDVKREASFSNMDVIAGDEEETNYRTISGLAIASLLLGLAAPLCLVAPLLFAIPLLGFVLALAAVARIARSDGQMVGRGAALVGMALCVASVCGAIAQSTVTEQMLSRQAREMALEWVALLQAGGGQQAFELTLAHAQGPPPKPPVNMPNHVEEAGESPLDHFLHDPVVAYLMGDGRTAQIRFDRDLASGSESTGVYRIAQQYSVVNAQAPADQPAPTIRMTLQRTRSNRLVPARWLISTHEGEHLPITKSGV